MFVPVDNVELPIPNLRLSLRDGDIIKLGRFDDESWIVHFGWFSFGGNRPICGWYLSSCINEEMVKPLSLADLDDIYLIEH